MKKGFTLLELIVVIIIIGILATLGFSQYGAMMEKSRKAEAKAVISTIRSTAAAFRLEHNNDMSTLINATAGIGVSADQIPSACRATNFFSYAISGVNANGLTITATRCTAGGKVPQGGTPGTVILTVDFNAGTDVWSGTF